MDITNMPHPPAVATTLVFFNIEKTPPLLFNIIPLNPLIAFAIGLVIVSGVAYLSEKVFDKKNNST